MGKVSNLTNLFQMGWFNHQLVVVVVVVVVLRCLKNEAIYDLTSRYLSGFRDPAKDGALGSDVFAS